MNLHYKTVLILLLLSISISYLVVRSDFVAIENVITQVGEKIKTDRPDLAWEQNFKMTLDPSLGYVPFERLFIAYEKAKISRMSNPVSVQWEERGPSNVGGRTRAVMWDPNDNNNKKVWVGGVAGGLWFTNDITSNTPVWNHVDDFWDNIAISSIEFDPTNTQVFYVGTGEGWFNVDAVRGAGVWKTTDGGNNWARLTSTNNTNFYYVQKIKVHPSTGDVYVATRDNGIMRSTDGGTSWNAVLNTSTSPSSSSTDRAADIELGSDNSIYVSMGIFSTDGVYSSTTGNAGDWTKLNSGTNGFPNTGIRRIELATAPSNANIIYALVQGSGNAIENLYKTTDKGANWTVLTTPMNVDGNTFAKNQAWYDLIATVHPTNSDIVYIGGVDLFRTTNGGTGWSQISRWFEGTSLPYVHADQHAILFRPNNINEIIVGNDGGIHYTIDSGSDFLNKNNGYNITQFYSGDIHPQNNIEYLLGGTQDNGTQQFDAVGIDETVQVVGGDGGYSFIDKLDPNFQIASYIRNNYYRSTNGGNTFTSISSDNTGLFINPADYDSDSKILYAAKDATSLKRIKNITGNPVVDDLTGLTLGSTASNIKVSPYSSNTIFVGTQFSKVFKIENSDTDSPTVTDISGSNFTGYLSSIELGASDNQILVTFSSYGVISVWETLDGGTNWSNKEGNLPDMPVRWTIYNPNNRKEVMLATEIGVWMTQNLNESSPNWVASNNGLANVRTDMLKIRGSDFRVIAATHGRGMFSTDAFNLSSQGNNIDVALVIDKSGSMGNYGYMEPAKTAASTFVGLMQIGDRIGVVSFNQNATVNFPLTTIISEATKTDAQNAISAITSGGATSIGGGIQEGQNQLNNGNTSVHQGMILLSDGQQNSPPMVEDVLPTIPENTDIYTIALGPNSDQVLLNDIAAQTGGFYSFAPDASGLQNIYNTIRANVTGQQVIANFSGSINQGQTITHNAPVDGSVTNATFAVTWPGSDLDLELIDPNGRIINPDTALVDPDIEFSTGNTYEFYTVNSPVAGDWTLKIIAIDLPSGSEDYNASIIGTATLTMDVYFSKNEYGVGEPILISADINEEGTPILNASVTADVLTPTIASVMAFRKYRNQSIEEEMTNNQESMTMLHSISKNGVVSYISDEGELFYLNTTITLFDDGAHGDGGANDGIYANYFTDTNIEGSYTFTVHASGVSPINGNFTREATKSTVVNVPPDPQISVIPDSLFFEVVEGNTATDILTIYNSGAQDLIWNATESDALILKMTNEMIQSSSTFLNSPVVSQSYNNDFNEKFNIRSDNIFKMDLNAKNKSLKPHLIKYRTINNDSPNITYFSDDMESGTNGWTTELIGGSTDDLWHQTSLDYNSSNNSWWFGIESQGNYNTGNRINSAVISPSIDLIGATAPLTLEFFENYDTEPGWDYCMVDITTDGGGTWTQLRGNSAPSGGGNAPSGNSGGWILSTIDISSYAGQLVQVRFYFDTNDGAANTFAGWFFDDVEVFSGGGSDVMWLSETPINGIIQPGDSQIMTVEVNGAGLNVGNYNGNIIINSNDPNNPNLTIPVSLNVMPSQPLGNEIGIVTNYNDRSIHIIDVQNNTIAGPYLVGNLGNSGELLDPVLTPDGKTSLITNFTNNSVFFVDLTNPASPIVIDTINISFAAEDIALTDNGAFALVTDGGLASSIAVIDVNNRTLIQTLDISPRNAQSVAISGDGTVLVTDYNGNQVHVLLINTTTGVITDLNNAISVTQGPINISISPDGGTALVASYSGSIEVLQILNPGNVILNGTINNISAPQSISFDNNSLRAFVVETGSSPDQVAILNILSPGNVTDSGIRIPTLSDLSSAFYGVDVIDVNSNGQFGYVGNPGTGLGSNYVAVLDLINYVLIDSLLGGDFPVGIVLGGTQTDTTDFAVNFSVFDNGTGQSTLVFGTAPGATEGYDPGLDVEAPPQPPGGFDARLRIPSVDLLKDFRATNLDSIRIWDVIYQTDPPDEPISFSWDPGQLPPDGNFTLIDFATGGTYVNVNMRTNISYTDSIVLGHLQIIFNYEVSVNFDFAEGWNMLSLPLDVPGPNYLTLFANAVPGTLFGYDSSGYYPATSIDATKGYWLKFPAAESDNVEGVEITLMNIGLALGWNMIGGPNCSVPIGNIEDPGGIIISGTIFGYDSSGYYPATYIDATKGYWIKASAPGAITISCVTFLAKGGNDLTIPVATLTDFGKIDISDAGSKGQILYFNSKLDGNISIESFSMPPVSPQGSFDARLTGNYRLNESDEVTIQVQSSNYPLSITVSDLNYEEGYGYVLQEIISGVEVASHKIVDGVKIVISNENVSLLKITKRLQAIPTSFKLAQNYPNPFNPSTMIKYDLPETRNVTLVIYNALGEQVRTLVSGMQDAGYYSILWDAKNDLGSKVGSGVYIYALRAGNYYSVKKMMLLK